MLEGIRGRQQFRGEDIQRRNQVSLWIIEAMLVAKEI
jgi:hypothetical protein